MDTEILFLSQWSSSLKIRKSPLFVKQRREKWSDVYKSWETPWVSLFLQWIISCAHQPPFLVENEPAHHRLRVTVCVCVCVCVCLLFNRLLRIFLTSSSLLLLHSFCQNQQQRGSIGTVDDHKERRELWRWRRNFFLFSFYCETWICQRKDVTG